MITLSLAAILRAPNIVKSYHIRRLNVASSWIDDWIHNPIVHGLAAVDIGSETSQSREATAWLSPWNSVD